MNRVSTGFLSFLLVTTISSEASVAKFHPKNLFIKMKAGQKLATSVLIERSQKVVSGLYLVESSNLEKLKQDLESDASIDYVENDYYAEKSSEKHEQVEFSPAQQSFSSFEIDVNFWNDPQLNNLWGFSEAGMNVFNAYESLPVYRPETITVAVVDTGVDYTHEDLKDVMWVNAKEIPGDKIDNDKNGYIDDIRGINTLIRKNKKATVDTGTNSSRAGGYYHGTHVAGTIGAAHNNKLGVAGVANNVKIMALRAVPDTNDELDSDVIEAFKYAAENGAKIINCSFGKSESGKVVRDVMNLLGKKHNVLFVVAAGNDGTNNDKTPRFPASFDSDNMIVVAATNISGNFSDFSNFGQISVDVSAPGSSILSTMPGNEYEYLSGTSMASPHVAGAAALILGYYPHLSFSQLKEVLMTSVHTMVPSKKKVATGGQVNLKAALEKAAEI